MQINPEILIATLVSRWREISAEPANLETNIRAAVMGCESYLGSVDLRSKLVYGVLIEPIPISKQRDSSGFQNQT